MAVSPSNASNKTVTWSSDNSGIASVNNGLVTAVKEGTTTIRVRATDGSNKEATCKVTVESAGLSAEDIASNPKDYYGKTVKGYDAEYGDVVGWKIFYAGNEYSSDNSYHVYLIADDYITRDNIPASSKGNRLNAGDSSHPCAAYFTNILNDYNGSSSITNNVKNLNKKYFENGYSSTNNNMKAVAYMLDTKAWSVYAGEGAQYAVGGPSIEMIMKSYSQAHGVDYRAQAYSTTGYRISNNGDSNWKYTIDDMLSTSDSLYVINSDDDASGYWVASPSAGSFFYVMRVNCYGSVNYYHYDNYNMRFPPPSLSKL